MMPDIDEARRVYGEVNQTIRSAFESPRPKPLDEVIREFRRWLETYARPHIPTDDFDRIMSEVSEVERQLEMATVVTNLISTSLPLPDQDVFKSSSGVTAMRQYSGE